MWPFRSSDNRTVEIMGVRYTIRRVLPWFVAQGKQVPELFRLQMAQASQEEWANYMANENRLERDTVSIIEAGIAGPKGCLDAIYNDPERMKNVYVEILAYSMNDGSLQGFLNERRLRKSFLDYHRAITAHQN